MTELVDMEGTILPLILEIAPRRVKIVYTGVRKLGNSSERTKNGRKCLSDGANQSKNSS